MSNFAVEVVKLGPVNKHENADTLGITRVYDFPVVCKLTDFKEGDKAIYIPVDAICPDKPEYAFLGSKKRIKAKRLRGTFSMGLLMPIPATVAADDPQWEVGKDVAAILEIVKYEEPEPSINGPKFLGGDCEPDPGFIPKYTDIQNYRRYPDVIKAGEEVVITEKIHGTNFRFAFKDDKLYVGSHNTFKKENPDSVWWKVVDQYGLREKAKAYPGLIFYGEIYGAIQDLKYGCTQGQYKLAIFDIFDLTEGRYIDNILVELHCKTVNLPAVPTLYSGPFEPAMLEIYGEGRSTIADHIKEGCVVKPMHERYDDKIGRCVLKYISEEYLTRKDGTEHH